MTSQDQLKYSYWAFALCVITCSVPQMMVQTFAMFFSIVMLIAFYVLRSRKTKETFEHNEFSALIKSFWVWSGIYVGGVFIAGILISTFGDMSAIHEWTEAVVQGAVPDEDSLKLATQKYMESNFNLMIGSTLLSILPAQIYAIIRIKQGLQRLANPPVAPPEAIIG